jgi:hypothetical protein
MGKELSRFAGICYGDPRPEYVGCSVQNGAVVTEFHPELLSEKNTSLCAMNQYYVSDSWKRLMPMGIWAGPLARPAISLHVTCDDCSWTGIKEMAKKNVTVYPNPATDNFTVTLDATGKSNIEMFNLVGQKVYSKTTSDATVTVNVNNFKSGVYMLKINQNGQVYTSKVVVK